MVIDVPYITNEKLEIGVSKRHQNGLILQFNVIAKNRLKEILKFDFFKRSSKNSLILLLYFVVTCSLWMKKMMKLDFFKCTLFAKFKNGSLS